MAEPFLAAWTGETLRVRGLFGVFAPGYLEIVAEDAKGRIVDNQRILGAVTPLAAAAVSANLKIPDSARTVALMALDRNGQPIGELAHATIDLR